MFYFGKQVWYFSLLCHNYPTLSYFINWILKYFAGILVFMSEVLVRTS